MHNTLIAQVTKLSWCILCVSFCRYRYMHNHTVHKRETHSIYRCCITITLYFSASRCKHSYTTYYVYATHTYCAVSKTAESPILFQFNYTPLMKQRKTRIHVFRFKLRLIFRSNSIWSDFF